MNRRYFDMDNVLVDFGSGIAKLDSKTIEEYARMLDEVPCIFSLLEPMSAAIESVHKLAVMYEVYILSTAPWKNPSAWADKVAWVTKYFDGVFQKRMILTHHKDFLKEVFQIDNRPKHGADSFDGEYIQFGSDEFPDWPAVVEYLKNKAD